MRYLNFKVYDPVYVAIDKGMFQECDVQIVGDVLAGPTAIQAVAAGSADAALSSVPAIINANAAALPIQGVIDIQTSFPDQTLQAWFVKADSPIQSLADTPGTDYGINLVRSSFDYTSRLALLEAGIDPASVNFQLLAFPDQITALMQGSIDVAGLMEPWQTVLRNEYGDQVRQVWADVPDAFGGQSRHVSLIFVNRVWAKANPEAASCFVAGLKDAIDWIEKNPAEAQEIEAKYIGIDAANVPAAYHYTDSGLVRMEDVEWWMSKLVEIDGLAIDLKKQPWMVPEEIATNAYNPASK